MNLGPPCVCALAMGTPPGHRLSAGIAMQRSHMVSSAKIGNASTVRTKTGQEYKDSPFRRRTHGSAEYVPLAKHQTDAHSRPSARLYRPGQSMFRQGEPATHLYEIASGLFLLSKVTADGRRHIVEVAPSGWVCGFAEGNVHDCTCKAMTDGSAIAYPILEIESRYPEAERTRLWAQTARQICALHDHAMDLVEKSAEERVAAFLMRFVPGQRAPHCTRPDLGWDMVEIEIPLSGGEIGDYVGLRPESVSRAIRKLEESGLIRRVTGKRRGYQVRDVCKLCQTAHSECNL